MGELLLCFPPICLLCVQVLLRSVLVRQCFFAFAVRSRMTASYPTPQRGLCVVELASPKMGLHVTAAFYFAHVLPEAAAKGVIASHACTPMVVGFMLSRCTSTYFSPLMVTNFTFRCRSVWVSTVPSGITVVPNR